MKTEKTTDEGVKSLKEALSKYSKEELIEKLKYFFQMFMSSETEIEKEKNWTVSEILMIELNSRFFGEGKDGRKEVKKIQTRLLKELKEEFFNRNK